MGGALGAFGAKAKGAGSGGYDVAVAADMDGEVAECRTRFTSLKPSAEHRSTVRTKYEVSISLMI